MDCLFDLSYINSEAKSRESVAIYAMRVLDGLSAQYRSNMVLLVAEEFAGYFREKYPGMKLQVYPMYNSRLASIPYIKGVYKMLYWKNFVNSLEYEVVYIPFSWSGNSLKTRAKKVITIHDLRPMRGANRAFTKTFWFKALRLSKVYMACSRYFYTRHLRNAAKVIAISDYVRKDIAREWPEYASKVETVYNGVVLAPKAICPNFDLGDSSYILYVNTLSAYKNVKTLVKAFDMIRDDWKRLRLVVVGKDTDYWRNEVMKYILERGFTDRVVRILYCSDEELRWLYEHASLFVTTSTREGFGYTPIEAAICRCPVVSTLAESLPDVTDNRLNYYDPPYDWQQLASLMSSLLLRPLDERKLQEISSYYSARYDNTSQSEKIYNVIKSVCSK